MPTPKHFPMRILFMAFCVGVCLPAGFSQARPPKGPVVLAVNSIAATDALKESVAEKDGDVAQNLQRVVQSMDPQFIDRLHNTRMCKVIARSAMQEILEDQDLQEVFADPSDPNSAEKFKQAGAKYVVTVKVDGFQDRLEKLHGPGGQLLARKRTIRVSAVAQIYDTTTMELLESANFQLEKTEGGRVTPNSSTNTLSSERLLTELSRQMAHKAANRVIDVLFPAVVLVRRDAIITFNRGDGTNVEKGQEWDVFAKGEELIDPYTGASLGAEEVLVGKAEVIRITPKFSQARLVEDFGVERGNVMRLSKPQED